MQLVTPRLLITDDDRDFRETVAGVLTDRGFETLQAADGEEALEIVVRQEVHLLLLDMQMPRLSGLETIERLHGLFGVRRGLPTTPAGRDQLEGTAAQSWFPSAGPSEPRPQLTLPWILISGALDDSLIARAKAAAVFSVLPKPVRLPDLTGAVAGALAHAYNWRAA
jgi:CheY-like chemotaxis protein